MTPQKDLFSLQKLPPRRNKYLNVQSKIDNSRASPEKQRNSSQREVSPHQKFKQISAKFQRVRLSLDSNGAGGGALTTALYPNEPSQS